VCGGYKRVKGYRGKVGEGEGGGKLIQGKDLYLVGYLKAL